MNTTIAAVTDVAAIDHDEAMHIAEAEYQRVLDVVDRLGPDDWVRPTDCTEWDVRAVLGHLLGMLERNADQQEAMRQMKAAAAIAQQTGGLRLDAMTGLQVREHAHLTAVELVQALHVAAPRSLTARRASSDEQRATTYTPELPGEGTWTIGYLTDLIHTRDPWIHRVDISRAVGRDLVLTPEHDGRIVADVVREWAGRHDRAFTLVLEGAAGGTFTAQGGGPTIQLDAIEFCRILSGRFAGAGLLGTRVPF